MSIPTLDLKDIYCFMQRYHLAYNSHPTGMIIARSMGLTQIKVISRQKKLVKLGLLIHRKGKHPAYILAGTED